MFGIIVTMKRLMLTALAFAVGLPWAFAGGDCRKGVTILFTNDAHTHVDNRKGRGLRYSQIAWLKKACAEKKPTFLVDAGDYLQARVWQARFPIVSCNAWRRTSAEDERTPAFAAYAKLGVYGKARLGEFVF